MTPCDNCISGGTKCVPGRGPKDARLVLVGEGPGADEERHVPPMPFVGKTGQEAENYLTVLSRIDIDTVYWTNLVKCRPPNNRDPKPSEIESCSKILWHEINGIKPECIACLGRYSTRYFLGNDVELERIHGIPIEKDGMIIVPMYHPAAGMHNTGLMTQIAYDFEVLGRVVRGQAKIGELSDPYPEETCRYHLLESRYVDSRKWLREYLCQYGLIAIDTESVKDSATIPWRGRTVPWCVSVSLSPGTAMVIKVEDVDLIQQVSEKLARPSTLTLIHNSMYDLPILADMGVRPARFYDTMVMAYLTQSLPQSLKDLAYRLCGMAMSSYDEMVEEAGSRNAIHYLQQVGGVVWPDTEPELVWAKGMPSVKKGWPLHKRVGKMLRDYEKDNTVDLRDRWGKVELRLRGVAEEKFGLMPIGDLRDIDLGKAVRYSGRDADATLRVYPHLLEMIHHMNINYQG